MKTKIIIIFLAAITIGGFYYLFNNSGDASEMQPALNDNSAVENIKEEAEKQVEDQVPSDLKECPQDIFSNMSACSDLSDNKVCGYDKTTYEDGTVKTHGLEYRTPCHYCNFFGEDMEKDMMGTKVEALGYSVGKCD